MVAPMPGRFESFAFAINPQVGFGNNGEDKQHFLAALTALEQLVAGDRVSEADDSALDALGYLKLYVRDEC